MNSKLLLHQITGLVPKAFIRGMRAPLKKLSQLRHWLKNAERRLLRFISLETKNEEILSKKAMIFSKHNELKSRATMCIIQMRPVSRKVAIMTK